MKLVIEALLCVAGAFAAGYFFGRLRGYAAAVNATKKILPGLADALARLDPKK